MSHNLWIINDKWWWENDEKACWMVNQKVQQAKHYWIHFVISITMVFHKTKNFILRFNHMMRFDLIWPQFKLQIRNRNDGYCVPISPGQWEKINCGFSTCLADTCDANFMTSQENIFLAFGDTEIKVRDLRRQLKSSDGSFTSSDSDFRVVQSVREFLI